MKLTKEILYHFFKKGKESKIKNKRYIESEFDYLYEELNEEMNSSTSDNFIYDVEKTLSNLQDRTIGFFKPLSSTVIEMVVEVDRTMVKTVTIGSLGGVIITHIESSQGILYLFENGENLTFIKKDPFGLINITESLKKNKMP